MGKSEGGFYKIRNAWRRLTPLREYVAMTLRPVEEWYIHHTVTHPGGIYTKTLQQERAARRTGRTQDAQRLRKKARKIERDHMTYLEQVAINRGFEGISYTDIVFPSGRVYKGRGFAKVGAHTLGRNSRSYGIAAVGNYDVDVPSEELIEGLGKTIRKGIKWHRIKKAASGRGHRDVGSTACPGKNLYERLPAIRKKATKGLKR